MSAFDEHFRDFPSWNLEDAETNSSDLDDENEYFSNGH